MARVENDERPTIAELEKERARAHARGDYETASALLAQIRTIKQRGHGKLSGTHPPISNMEAPLLDAISSGEMQGVRVEAAERIELVDVQDDEVLARKCDQPVTAQALKPGSRELLENADLPAKLDHMPRT